MSFRYFALVMSLWVLVAPPVLAGLNDGLVAYYPFDGNANDASGNGNHGTVHGATLTEDRFGEVNSAYYFDGVDDYITNPYNEAWDFTNNNFTIAMWINVASLPTKEKNGNNPHVRLISSWESGHYGTATFVFWLNAKGQISGNFGTGSSWYETPDNFKTEPPVDVNNWYYALFNFTETTIDIYINGTLNTHRDRPSLQRGSEMMIGSWGWDPLNFQFPRVFYGGIDDIRIYNRALTASEIEALYQNVCGTKGEYTQAELDAAYQQGFTDGVATGSESGACQPATLSSDLKMHVPALHYTPPLLDTPIVLWADFELSDINNLLFQVTDYGVKEE